MQANCIPGTQVYTHTQIKCTECRGVELAKADGKIGDQCGGSWTRPQRRCWWGGCRTSSPPTGPFPASCPGSGPWPMRSRLALSVPSRAAGTASSHLGQYPTHRGHRSWQQGEIPFEPPGKTLLGWNHLHYSSLLPPEVHMVCSAHPPPPPPGRPPTEDTGLGNKAGNHLQPSFPVNLVLTSSRAVLLARCWTQWGQSKHMGSGMQARSSEIQ